MAETTFNLTIRESSPLWTFSPLSSDHSTQGWTSQCGVNLKPKQACDGHLARYTSTTSNATLTFTGSRIDVFGNYSEGMNWTMQIDSQPTLNISNQSAGGQGPLLGTFENLSSEPHTLTLSVIAPEQSSDVKFTLDRAEIVVGTGSSGVSVQPSFIHSLKTQYINYNQHKSWGSFPAFPGTHHPAQIPKPQIAHSQVPGATANITFNGIAIALYGPCSSANGQYNVSVNSEAAATLNGFRQRDTAGACLRFFRSGLSSNQTHSLVLTHADGKSRFTPLGWLKVFDVSSPNMTVDRPPNSESSSPSQSSRGTIAGAVVGSIFGALLLFGIAFLLYQCRRRKVHVTRSLSPTEKIQHWMETGAAGRPITSVHEDTWSLNERDRSERAASAFPSSYSTLTSLSFGTPRTWSNAMRSSYSTRTRSTPGNGQFHSRNQSFDVSSPGSRTMVASKIFGTRTAGSSTLASVDDYDKITPIVPDFPRQILPVHIAAHSIASQKVKDDLDAESGSGLESMRSSRRFADFRFPQQPAE